MLQETLQLIAQLKDAPSAENLAHQTIDLRRRLSQEMFSVVHAQPSEKILTEYCAVLEALAEAGVLASPVVDDVGVALSRAESKGWQGVFSALALVPCWILPKLPLLEALPFNLWGTYTRLRLILPDIFVHAGESEACSKNYAAFLRELCGLAEKNRGSAAVRQSLSAFAQSPDCELFLFSNYSKGDIGMYRARLLALVRGSRQPESVLAFPRDGRRLKIGFISACFDIKRLGAESIAHIALSLDPRMYEVVVYSGVAVSPELGKSLSKRGVQVLGLGIDVESSVDAMRMATLDVGVFATQSHHREDLVGEIMMRQVAPVQMSFDESGVCPAYPGTDLSFQPIVGNTWTRGIRVAGLPFCGIRFRSHEAEAVARREWTRESLGIPSDSLFIAAIGPFCSMSPEWLSECLAAMSLIPESRLLLYSPDPADCGSERIARFCASVGSHLEKHGIASERLVISSEKMEGTGELLSLLRLADIHVACEGLAAEYGSRLALEAGVVPIGAMGGIPHQVYRRSLVKVGLGDCIADDIPQAFSKISFLAKTPAALAELKERVRHLHGTPEFIEDPVAFGLCFGETVNLAFAQVSRDGVDVFRKNGSPLLLSCGDDAKMEITEVGLLLDAGLVDQAAIRMIRVLASHPTDPAARLVYAKILLRQKCWLLAADSLSSTIASQEDNAAQWFMLAQAFKGIGWREQSLSALETSLRLNPSGSDAWNFALKMAKEAGNEEMQKEISEVLAELEKNIPAPVGAVALPELPTLSFVPSSEVHIKP